ncbi:MAG: dTDP-4-amino-4,6-dideoxygalactose transaminase [Clostridiales Family XIII bacterium]|jgi:dTDP-4-amino-4,6-dideoxygalactose transaminase|nr:dTDP-4-amino-4,6-dideoxygalactose transaminase [Clostridiales Family XIII bacterium]
MTIPFNKAPYTGREPDFIREAMETHQLSGDGPFTKKCHELLEGITGRGRALLTTSGTHALEMAALLCDIRPGDEVIMPSFTFVSTANAFVLRGAKAVFADIRPDTLNLDEKLIESAVTARTKVIAPVHYGGVGCEMDEIMRIAEKYGLLVVEDAAQGVNAFYKGRALGSIGDFGCYSFHETKNYTMGEGGAVVVRDERYFEEAEILREKGTNRSKFFRGQIDKYTWVSAGSSYLPSELNAAYLYPQLLEADLINRSRLASWDLYYELLSPLAAQGAVSLPVVPEACAHNAHMFYIKVRNLAERRKVIKHLKNEGISAVFHYVPLHSAPAGERYGRFHGEDVYTTKESDRLIRLPMYFGLTPGDIHTVAQSIRRYYD